MQRDKEILQLWRNRSSCYKMLQTKEEEKRRSKDYRKNKKGFFPGQEMSTNLPILIDSKI